MEDDDLLDFVKAYNDALDHEKPDSALEWILFLDKHGFGVYKKNRD